MTKFIECPVCGSENKETDTLCQQCGYEFNFQEGSTKKSLDWLSDLRTTSDQNQNNELLDFLSDNESNNQETDSDTPDWLNRIRDRKEIDEEYDRISEQINQQVEKRQEPDQSKDFIESLRDNSGVNQEINSKESDLISNFRDQNNDSFYNTDQGSNKQSSEDNSESSEETTDQKDWLQRLPPINSENETEENNTNIPVWIQNSKTLQSNEDLIKSNKKDEELPDWISKFDSFDDDEEDQTAEAEQIPDWVQFSVEEESESNESDNDKNEEIPEWIATNLSSKDVDIPYETSNKDKVENFSSSQIDKNEDDSSEQTYPLQEASLDEFDLDNFQLSELPSSPQQQNIEDLTSDNNDDENVTFENPFIPDSIPEWVGEIGTSEDAPENEIEEDITGPFIKGDPEISPGELPGWLKAMRPIEAFTPEVNLKDKRRRIEKSGPLSGLSGVLSSEDVVKKYSAPPSYSVTLELSEKQKINAELLDQVFSPAQISENQNIQSSRNGENILRIFVSLFLLGILIFSMFSEIPSISMPDIIPAETVRFASISNGLLLSQENSPHILIVMDNEAASQAEISLMVQSVFERLMIKDSYLSIISSNPNANLVATSVLSRSNLTVPTFIATDRVSNFGYLPGNTIGIQSFLSNPRRTVPVGIFPEDIWNSPGLKDIYQISQFDSIILVTDNPENSKLWLEQIRLFIPEMPVLVASTAQASPLLQPYLDSNQIDGMISGLYGSIKYSELIQMESPTLVSYWNNYRVGIYTFIFIIVIGGIYSLINQFFFRAKTKVR